MALAGSPYCVYLLWQFIITIITVFYSPVGVVMICPSVCPSICLWHNAEPIYFMLATYLIMNQKPLKISDIDLLFHGHWVTSVIVTM